MIAWLLPVVLSFTLHASVSAQAQQAGEKPDSARVRFERVFPAAALGTGVGLYAGAYFGSQLGWGGGDDPGLISALLFGGIGSALGSGLGALVAEPRLSRGRALVSGFLGAAGGLFGIIALGEVFDGDGTKAVIAFSVISGAVTGVVVATARR